MTSSLAEERPMPKRRLLPLTVLLSFLLHGVAHATLEAAPAAVKPAPRKSQLRFDVVTKPPLPAPEPPPAETKPEPVPPAAPKAAPKPAPVTTPPVAAPEPMPGVTLAGDGSGPGFAMPLASGGALEPTRVPPAPPLNTPPPVAPPPRAPIEAAPALVALSDLSARPTPPTLGPALERNYPADARRRGLSGSAKVRARIDPDGVVRRVALLEESGPGFGSACSRTLNGSRWAAPKDKAGRAVATEIRYTCRFVVE